MAGVERRTFAEPDAVRTPPKATIEVGSVGTTVGDQPMVGIEFDPTTALTFARG